MAVTRWKPILKECISSIHRELRITFTPAPKPEKWVFVVGCYNSGTTLLAEILGSHPMISALPSEGQYLTDQLPSDHEIGLSRMWVEREDIYRLAPDNIEDADPERIKYEWGMRLDRNKPIFLEKTPANAARMPWLEKHFENAHFVGIVRNGYAVTAGISHKAKPIHRKSGWPIEMAAQQWMRSNEVMFDDAKKVNNFYWLKYEDFANDPNGELEKITDFITPGHSFNIDLSKGWAIHEKMEPISNMNSQSIAKLSDEEIQKIRSICASTLDQFGYTTEE
ncbi:sulfotransferase [Pseudomonadales bacterium]|nr:sulfotransferase [Pseudomonadales bacterium]